MLLNHYKPYLTRASPDHVEDVVAESLVEWDGLKSIIYRRWVWILINIYFTTNAPPRIIVNIDNNQLIW
jgi:hypothetical protein